MAKHFSKVIFSISFFVGLLTIFPQGGISVQEIKNSKILKEPNENVTSGQVDEVIAPVTQGYEKKKQREEILEDEAEFFEEELDFENELIETPTGEVDNKHPCQRTCEAGKPMTCRYKFTVEYYSTMSKACFKCPYNVTDCSSRHCIPGDGVKRTILVVNRQMPGPAIEVCYGDTIEVELKNQMLDVSTTIHWHGLFQKETPFMDGVPFVSQCLIGPQGNFLYRFFADNPGTHLWHSHSALQRGDGLYGPLIIKVPLEQDPHANLYDFDLSEHVITVLDWEHTLSVNKFVAHYHSTGDNKPPSILVNGKGRFHKFEDGDVVIQTPVEKFTVKPGSRYRFRIINAGFLNCPIEMSVDNHTLWVIASDGGNLKPVEAQTLVSLAGERFDIILEANQEVGNYWMRFKGLLDCTVKNAFQVAVLHYEGANEEEDPEGEPTWENSDREGLKINPVNSGSGTENALTMPELSSTPMTAEDPTLKPEPDVKFYIPYDFYPVDNIHYHPSYYGFYKALKNQRTYTPQINHISMQFPSFPLMADLERTNSLEFCNASSVSMECRFEFCECPHVLQVSLGAVVELILIDEGVPYEANHPFHLHGHSFRVIGTDRLGSSTSEEEVRRLDKEGLLKRNLENPPIKDTVTIPDGGYTILRFQASNPGYWILHCHLDFHVELGMALLFKIGEDSDHLPPPKDFPMCGDRFSPIPVNQTREHTAYFFPKKMFEEGQERRIEKIKDSSGNSLQLSYTAFVLLLLFFMF